jgi:FlaA1/EpsC-like NDP-sugar epimerase
MPPTTTATLKPDAVRSLLRFRRVPIVLVQLALVAVANYAAFLLRFDGHLPDQAWRAFEQGLPVLLVLRGAAFLPFRLYEGLWRYTSLYDLGMLAGGIASSSAAFLIWTALPWAPESYPGSIVFVDATIALLLLGGIRLTRRLASGLWTGERAGDRVFVYGAGDAGNMIVHEMKHNRSFGLRAIGFIDDDRGKVGRRIQGVRVLGTRAEAPVLVRKYRPTMVLIAVPSATPEVVRLIARTFEPLGVPLKTLPRLRDLIDGVVRVEQIRSLSIEDLLARPTVGLSVAPVRTLVEGRRVMVTGAGGSIGSELCRQILRFRPAALILFERYENSLHAIRMELDALTARGGRTQIFAVVGDVTDAPAVESALLRHRPEILFHAAAHKHVPLMEENPCEAVKNNVRGTRILAAAAEHAGVDRFIMISTDKAANPTTVMGASKRVAERLVMAQSTGSGTSFAVVRFGNVLGSNGSVVPHFAEQIRRGGPVTVTHPDVKRFFMLIPEAVSLVLHAAAKAHSGGTYVLDMGEQIKIVDLAANMIRQAGRVPGEDIPIIFTGLRPGEKIEEELVGRDEQLRPSDVTGVSFVVRPPLSATLHEEVASLESCAIGGDTAAVLTQLMAVAGATLPERVAESSSEPVRRQDAPSIPVMPCPNCATGSLHRSRARRPVDRVRRLITSRRMYRCDECQWHGWLEPVETMAPPSAYVPPPDLSSLDGPSATQSPRARRPSFSPRDL